MIRPFPAPFFKKKFPEPLKKLSFKHFRESVQCRRPESNRYGYHYPRDFKSRASASSATAAAMKLTSLIITDKRNDPEETRTLDLRRDRAAL